MRKGEDDNQSSITIDSNKQELGNSTYSGINLDCSNHEATVSFNHIVLPDNVTTQEQDIHSFLDLLNINQVNIKETH